MTSRVYRKPGYYKKYEKLTNPERISYENKYDGSVETYPPQVDGEIRGMFRNKKGVWSMWRQLAIPGIRRDCSKLKGFGIFYVDGLGDFFKKILSFSWRFKNMETLIK